MTPRFFWKILFRCRKKFTLFPKKAHPLELNYLELISNLNFSVHRKIFSKRLKLRNVISLKFTWFKYELQTPLESKVRAFCSLRHDSVQGVVKLSFQAMICHGPCDYKSQAWPVFSSSRQLFFFPIFFWKSLFFKTIKTVVEN